MGIDPALFDKMLASGFDHRYIYFESWELIRSIRRMRYHGKEAMENEDNDIYEEMRKAVLPREEGGNDRFELRSSIKLQYKYQSSSSSLFSSSSDI